MVHPRNVLLQAVRINDMEEKTISFKTGEATRRSILFRSASVVKLLISMRKVVQDSNDTFVRRGKGGKPTQIPARACAFIQLEMARGCGVLFTYKKKTAYPNQPNAQKKFPWLRRMGSAL